MIDRGFEAMIPRASEEEQEETDYDYNIEFNLFGRRFSFNFKVQTQE